MSKGKSVNHNEFNHPIPYSNSIHQYYLQINNYTLKKEQISMEHKSSLTLMILSIYEMYLKTTVTRWSYQIPWYMKINMEHFRIHPTYQIFMIWQHLTNAFLIFFHFEDQNVLSPTKHFCTTLPKSPLKWPQHNSFSIQTREHSFFFFKDFFFSWKGKFTDMDT